jgi:hypothetical protein
MDIIFENGTRADISRGVYLHHVVAIDLTKSQKGFVGSCPGELSGGVNKNQLPTFIGGAVVS